MINSCHGLANQQTLEFARLVFLYWQLDPHHGAATIGITDGDSAVMIADNFAADSEPKPTAIGLVCPVGLKRVAQYSPWETWPLV